MFAKALAQQGTRLISNGGGVNPMAAGQQMLADARALGLQGLKVGVVLGDDLLVALRDMLRNTLGRNDFGT